MSRDCDGEDLSVLNFPMNRLVSDADLVARCGGCKMVIHNKASHDIQYSLRGRGYGSRECDSVSERQSLIHVMSLNEVWVQQQCCMP